MATQQKVWIDGRGQEVPSSYVSKYDKARDRAMSAAKPDSVTW